MTILREPDVASYLSSPGIGVCQTGSIRDGGKPKLVTCSNPYHTGPIADAPVVAHVLAACPQVDRLACTWLRQNAEGQLKLTISPHAARRYLRCLRWRSC
jgi:hypothetical protein